MKLKQIVDKGLEQTISLFAPNTVAYNWIHKAAEIFDRLSMENLQVVVIVKLDSRWWLSFIHCPRDSPPEEELE